MMQVPAAIEARINSGALSAAGKLEMGLDNLDFIACVAEQVRRVAYWVTERVEKIQDL